MDRSTSLIDEQRQLVDRGPVVTEAPDFDRSVISDNLIVVADVMVAVEVLSRPDPVKQSSDAAHVRVRLLQQIVGPPGFAISRREVEAQPAFQSPDAPRSVVSDDHIGVPTIDDLVDLRVGQRFVREPPLAF